MDVELITLVNSFKNTIELNNLLIKKKIIRKLDMINTMRYYGFPIMNYPIITGNKIIDELRSIDKEGEILKYSNATNGSKTNKLLGEILHNAYQASGYDIILSNVPKYGTTIEDQIIQLDCEAIYDTLNRYTIADNVKSVFQIAEDKYLIKMDTKVSALDLCKLLHGNLLEHHVITMEYIKTLNNNIHDLDESNNNKLNNFSSNDATINIGFLGWCIHIMCALLVKMKNILWRNN